MPSIQVDNAKSNIHGAAEAAWTTYRQSNHQDFKANIPDFMSRAVVKHGF